MGVILSLIAILFGPPLQVAFAADLLNKSDTMSSLKDNTASDHTIVFRTPTGAGDSTDTITVEFDKGAGTAFTVPGALDFTDLDLAHSAGGQTSCSGVTFSNDETLAATASATAWGVSVNTTTDTITLTAPTDGVGVAAIAGNACVRMRIGTNATTGATGDQQITNPDITGATNYTIAIAGTFGDVGDIVVQIILDDQVAVSATVAEALTFSLSTNSVAFGTLSSAAVTTGSHTVTLATNAASGLTLTVSGSTLTSGSNTITAMSTAAASSVGTEQFGINAKDNATPNVGAECSGTSPIAAAATGYSTVDNFKFVSGETVISSSSGINSTTCTISYIANISAATEAGSYTTTLTYNATSNF